MRRSLAGLILVLSTTVSAAPKQAAVRPPMCASMDPTRLRDQIVAARKGAEAALDRKDFYGYEDWTEKKTGLIVDQKLWHYLCAEF